MTSEEVTSGIDKPIKLRTTAGSLGVSIVNDSRITFTQTGQYDLQFSTQLHNTGGGGNGTTTEFWLRKNNTDVPYTNTRVSVNTNSPYIVAAWDFILDVTSIGDYYELIWSTDNHHIEIAANTGQLGGPNIPSVIATVIPVMHAEVGAQGTTGAQGTVGSQGTTGAGTQGSNGAQGTQGTLGAGTQGTQGTLGAGTQGTTGSQGTSGATASAPLSLTQTSNDANYPLTISSANQQGGGTGYSDIIKLINSKSGASNINKHIRLNSTGGLEIVNSAYTSTIFAVSDGGNVNAAGTYNGASLGDTGWIQITSFGSGWSALGQSVYTRKMNNVVYMRGNVYNATGANTGAFTLPEGHRPATGMVFAVQQYGAGAVSYVTVGTDGVVVPNSTGAWLSNVVFPVG